MSAYRSSSAFDRQFPDCPRCSHDLTDLRQAVFCPGCGQRLKYKITLLEKAKESAAALLHTLTFGRLGYIQEPTVQLTGDRTPIMIGYGKAMYKLGWHYERASLANLPEALRCYRKSARLGNTDAAVKLASKTRSG